MCAFAKLVLYELVKGGIVALPVLGEILQVKTMDETYLLCKGEHSREFLLPLKSKERGRNRYN